MDASANPHRVEPSRNDGWRTGAREGEESTKERKAGARIHRAGKSRGSYVKRNKEEYPEKERRDYIVIREEC